MMFSSGRLTAESFWPAVHDDRAASALFSGLPRRRIWHKMCAADWSRAGPALAVVCPPAPVKPKAKSSTTIAVAVAPELAKPTKAPKPKPTSHVSTVVSAPGKPTASDVAPRAGCPRCRYAASGCRTCLVLG